MRETLGEWYEIGSYRVELVRETGRTVYARANATNAKAVAGVVMQHIGNATDREHFVAVLLDCRLHVLGVTTVSVGALDTCPAHVREVFKPAILAGAHSIILAHNHPSGDATPSLPDIALTARMIAAGELLGIEVLDHVVVGDGQYCSMRETADAARTDAADAPSN
jgi:DNA repair protein RadC